MIESRREMSTSAPASLAGSPAPSAGISAASSESNFSEVDEASHSTYNYMTKDEEAAASQGMTIVFITFSRIFNGINSDPYPYPSK